MFSETAIDSIVELTKYSFAGFYLTALMFASYCAGAVFKRSLFNVEANNFETANAKRWSFILSKPAAVVYIIIYIISFFSSDMPSYMIFALQTVAYPIQLGLIYMGAGVFWKNIRSGKISIIALIVVAVMANIIFGSFLSILIWLVTFFGLIAVFKTKNPQVK